MPTEPPPASQTAPPRAGRVEAHPRLQVLQHRVARAALCGVACEKIEQLVIEPSDLTDDEKSALRLYTRSFSKTASDRFELRRKAFEHLRRLSLAGDASNEQWTG